MKSLIRARARGPWWPLVVVLAVTAGCSGDWSGSTTTLPPGTAKSLALLAGSTGGCGLRDGAGASARLMFPGMLTIDRDDNVYVADVRNAIIRKVSPAGVVTTFAGIANVHITLDGPAGVATFANPSLVAADAQGAVYVLDNATIRRIAPSGAVSTVAGPLEGLVTGMVVDSAGNLILVTTGAIRRVTPAGEVTILGGSGQQLAGPLHSVDFRNARTLALDRDGSILVADGSALIRRISNLATVTLVAGAPGEDAPVDGDLATARLGTLSGIAADASGNIYATEEFQFVVRRVGGGQVVTFAGLRNMAGTADGRGSSARFNGSRGAVTDRAGNLIVADSQGCTLRRISPLADVVTFAGAAREAGSADGAGAAARFSAATGIARDANGNLFLADSANRTIRRISPGAAVSTVSLESSDAPFIGPNAVAIDAGGTIFVADGGIVSAGRVQSARAGSLKRISTAGVSTTIALTGIDYVGSVAIDAAGNTWAGVGLCGAYPFGVSVPPPRESGCTGGFRRIQPNGLVTAVAWPSNTVPTGIAIDGAGNLYASSAQGHIIARIAPDGSVTTIAGAQGIAGSNDGAGAQARFNSPHGLALDDAGNLYVADTGNSTVRKITPAGVVSTVVGVAGEDAFLPGDLPARLNAPEGVAIVGNDLFIAMPYGIGVVRDRP